MTKLFFKNSELKLMSAFFNQEAFNLLYDDLCTIESECSKPIVHEIISSWRDFLLNNVIIKPDSFFDE